MTRRAQAYQPVRRSDEPLALVMLACLALAIVPRAVVQFGAARVLYKSISLRSALN